MRKFRLCLTAAALALPALPLVASAQSSVPEYLARYEVRHKGRRVAEAEFAVGAEDTGGFSFRSSTQARGLLKLANPDPAIEHSRFLIDAGGIRPTRFDYIDGSRKGEDNYSVSFDPSRDLIRIQAAETIQSIPFAAGLLDRGSLQLALMLDLADCVAPGPYRWVDEDGIKTYRYERLDDAIAETGAGDFPTVRFVQQREGSSRSTVLWLASELSYLPVRIEQFRDGEAETVFSLENLSGIERSPSPCSGFR